MTQRVSIDPLPLRQGGKATIRYDFGGLDLVLVNLQVHWDPNGLAVEAAISADDHPPGATIDVPANAESLTIKDLSGASPALYTSVSPP